MGPAAICHVATLFPVASVQVAPDWTKENAEVTISARKELAHRLDALYAAAGAPPLKAISARATREVRARNPRGREVSAQRISDWRLGRSVPAKFDGLAAVLSVLVSAARTRVPNPALPGLYSAPEWRALWLRAREERAGAAPPATSVCPYPGLAPMSIDDAEFFAGRDSQIAALRARFTASLGSGDPLILVGDSGVGKSSLLQAGFAARIRDQFDVLLTTPGAVAAEELSSWAHARAAVDRPFVLAIDHLEELFLSPFDTASADRYLDVLLAMSAASPAGPGECAAVIATMRADFYTDAARHPTLAALLEHNQMLLGPPTATELTAAITEPAGRQGLRIGDGLVELILADLGVRGAGPGLTLRAGTFPLLAHALRSTWEVRDGDVMSVRAYEEAGGVRGAIAATAEHQWKQFTPTERDTARIMLLQLVTPMADGTAVGRHLDRATLVQRCPSPDVANKVLNTLAGARIVTQDAYGTALAHDAILSAWPRLAEWIGEDREDAIVRDRLQTDADEWASTGKDRTLLYRGSRLDIATALHARTPNALSALATDYLHTSGQAHRRRQLAWRLLAVFLVTGFVVTSALAVVALRQRQRAEHERTDAEFAALIAQAQRDRSTDPTESAQLALAAHAARPASPQAQGLLLASQSSPLAATVPAHRGAIYGAALARSGLVASAGYDNTIRLWQRDPAAGLTAVGTGLATESWIAAVAFADDSKTVFGSGGLGLVHQWSITDPRRPQRGPDIDLGHRGAVYAVATRSGGRWIATAGDDGSVRLHDSLGGRTVTLTGHTGPVRTVAFSPDGTTLVSGGDDRTARVWDVSDPAAARPLGQPLTGQSLTIHSVAFSPGAAVLATGSDDQTFQLWSIRDRSAVTPLSPPVPARSAAVWSLAFSPDGLTLVTAGRDGTADMWSVIDPARPVSAGMPLDGSRGALATVLFLDAQQVLTGGQSGSLQVWSLPHTAIAGHTGQVQAPSFDASGRLMATGSLDGQVLMWETSGPKPRQLATVLPLSAGRQVENVALAPNGHTLAITRADSGDVLLFDTKTPAAPKPAATITLPRARYAHTIVFAPDSRVLATASDDRSLQLWNVADPARPVAQGPPLTGPGGWINATVFAPDGSFVYAAAGDGTVHSWDIRASQSAGTQLARQPGAVVALAISRDATLLATGGDDQIIRILKVHGHDAHQLTQLPEHASTVRSLSFDPVSALLASGSDDQTVRLWSVNNPAAPVALGPSIAPSGTVRWRVQFSPAGRLAAGGDSAALSWWTTDIAAEAERICRATAGSELAGDQARWRPELDRACGH